MCRNIHILLIITKPVTAGYIYIYIYIWTFNAGHYDCTQVLHEYIMTQIHSAKTKTESSFYRSEEARSALLDG